MEHIHNNISTSVSSGLSVKLYLVTRNAGSLMISVPTRTWPCCISCVAILIVWAMRSRIITTGRRRRQKLEAVTLSHDSRSHLVLISPIMYLAQFTVQSLFRLAGNIYNLFAIGYLNIKQNNFVVILILMV